VVVAFDNIEYRPYGGTILHTQLSGIAGNFETADVEVLLTILALMDEAMENILAAPVIVARPRGC
jgi:hypothetical protein